MAVNTLRTRPSFMEWDKDTKMFFLRSMYEAAYNTPDTKFTCAVFRETDGRRCVMATALDDPKIQQLLGLLPVRTGPALDPQTVVYSPAGDTVEYSAVFKESWVFSMVASYPTYEPLYTTSSLWYNPRIRLLCQILLLAELVYTDHPLLATCSDEPGSAYRLLKREMVRRVQSHQFVGI